MRNALLSKACILPALAAMLLAGAISPATAQDKYPSRPIEFIVPWGPGGGADQLARKIAPGIEKELKVSLPVINVAGATGQTGLNKMLTQPADGYSISIFIADTLAVQVDPATKWKVEDIVPAALVAGEDGNALPRHVNMPQDERKSALADRAESYENQPSLKPSVLLFFHSSMG